MSLDALQNYLPDGSMPYLAKWMAGHRLHISITKDRASKLGDYRRMPDGSHKITLNHTLQPELFLFTLTHELAHLHAFVKFGRRIAPHGKEWKFTYGNMLLESREVYQPAFQPILLQFMRSPKANFLADAQLVKYFGYHHAENNATFVENIPVNEYFNSRGQLFQMIGKRRKNYLCTNLANGKTYYFQPLATVEKL